jgi:hypothetical protein
MKFCMPVHEQMWPFNTGDCLIEVTAWAGLIVLNYSQKVTVNLSLHNITLFFYFFYLNISTQWKRDNSFVC